MWKLRNIYLYLVCFVTLMMMIAGIIGSISAITNIYFPVDYSYYESFPTEPSKEVPQAKKDKEEARRIQERNRSNETKRQLISSFSVVFVALPIFAYHWKKIENEKEV
ncbi:MAG: hypothetical protein ACM3KR_00745 [Deltaproteobacteria bacterium]